MQYDNLRCGSRSASSESFLLSGAFWRFFALDVPDSKLSGFFFFLLLFHFFKKGFIPGKVWINRLGREWSILLHELDSSALLFLSAISSAIVPGKA